MVNYLDYCLNTQEISLQTRNSVQIPILAQYMIYRPELKKYLVLESVDTRMGRYKEVSKLIIGDVSYIQLCIENKIEELNQIIVEIERLKQDALKKFNESSKISINEKSIQTIKDKINNLDASKKEDFEKIQVYIKEINRQEKGLRREINRMKNNNRITQNYDYDIQKLKNKIFTLNEYLKIIKKKQQLKIYMN